MAYQDRIGEVLAQGVVVRSRDLELCGVSTAAIKRLVARGELERVEGPNGVLLGLRLPVEKNSPDMRWARMAEITARHPRAILCLRTAMRYHEITDDIEGCDTAGVPARTNRTTSLPELRLISWSLPQMHWLGVEEVELAGLKCRVTNLSRTVVDLFRPEHAITEADQQLALQHLIDREGSQGLERAASYALELGWFGSIQLALVTAEELVKWRGMSVK